MKKIRLYFAILLLLCDYAFAVDVRFTATNRSTEGLYPDEVLTPGVIDPKVTVKKLCTNGYTTDVRNVLASTKKKILTEYGVALTDSGKYEIDHFISLENGGLNDEKNLWAQQYCQVGNDPLKSDCWGAREKDKVETALHRWLCKGQITLEQDQKILRTDWIACYKQLASDGVCKP